MKQEAEEAFGTAEAEHIPTGTYLACCLQAVHNSWQEPESWRPERFHPGGEYDGFKEDIRPFMV